MNGNTLRALSFFDEENEDIIYTVDDVIGEYVALVIQHKSQYSPLIRTFKTKPRWIFKHISFLRDKEMQQTAELLEELSGMSVEQMAADMKVEQDTKKIIHP